MTDSLHKNHPTVTQTSHAHDTLPPRCSATLVRTVAQTNSPHNTVEPMFPGTHTSSLLALGLMVLLMGCAASDQDPRQVWLHNTLIEDNQALLERDPALTGGKFRKMAASPYNHFRGTLGQFLRDMATPGPGHVPTAFSSAASARVRLVGDPHMENIGSYLNANGELVVDFNDFDAATYGPWIYDLRRLALSAWIVGQQTQLGPEEDRLPDDMAQAVAQGYVDEFQSLQGGAQPMQIRRDGGFGRLIEDLLRRAARDGDAREELTEYTVVQNQRRSAFVGVLEPRQDPKIIEDELVELSNQEKALVERALRDYPATLVDPVDDPQRFFAAKGISRRLGAGVSSYPVLRYYVVIEGPSPALEDDILLEMKETGNANLLPGLNLYPGKRFVDNAHRVVDAQRTLQEGHRNDPLLGHATVGPIALRVRNRTKYQKGISHRRMVEKVAEGDWREDDLRQLAYLSGRLLARAHAQSTTITGQRGQDVILPMLQGQSDALLSEIAAFTDSYGPQTLADHQTLVRLLEREGPLLGYRPQILRRGP